MRPIITAGTEAAQPFPLACADELPMRVFRHIGAAYETGDAQCWEAAHARADAALGAVTGSLLVAHATAVVRLIRVDRPDFAFLPTPCRTLSGDEAAMLALLRAARTTPPPLAAAARILDDLGSIGLLAAAACALVGHDIPPVPAGALHASQGARLKTLSSARSDQF